MHCICQLLFYGLALIRRWTDAGGLFIRSISLVTVSWSRIVTTWKYIVSSEVIFLSLNWALVCANQTFGWAAQNMGSLMATEATNILLVPGSPMWQQQLHVTKQSSYTNTAKLIQSTWCSNNRFDTIIL